MTFVKSFIFSFIFCFLILQYQSLENKKTEELSKKNKEQSLKKHGGNEPLEHKKHLNPTLNENQKKGHHNEEEPQIVY